MRNLIRGLMSALVLAALPLAANASVALGISVNFAPPELPVYVQPEIPAPGYIWTPGYWAWSPAGYYWVPGTWVLPPAVGLLWTPGYWGFVDGAYLWHGGYWGPHVGFYGGINYGCGYGGVGYQGGYWHGHDFMYNRAYSNVRNINVTNVYNRTIVNNGSVTRVSFNGGAGGIAARPSRTELAAVHERHVAFTSDQRRQENMARGNESLRASVNGGHPAIAATPRPGAFSGHGVVAARDARVPASFHNDRPPQASGNHAAADGNRMTSVPHNDRPPQASGNHAAADGNRMTSVPHNDRPPQASGNHAAADANRMTSVPHNDRPPQASGNHAGGADSNRVMTAPQAQARPPAYHNERPPQSTGNHAADSNRAMTAPQAQARPPAYHNERPPQVASNRGPDFNRVAPAPQPARPAYSGAPHAAEPVSHAPQAQTGRPPAGHEAHGEQQGPGRR